MAHPLDEVTYSKLPDGSWGVRGARLMPGATVHVTKKDGTQRRETIGRIVRRDQGVQVATIVASGGRGGDRRDEVQADLPDVGDPAPARAEPGGRQIPLEVRVLPGAVARTADGVTVQLTIEVRKATPAMAPPRGQTRVQ